MLVYLVNHKWGQEIMYVAALFYRKWDRPCYSVTLVSRDVWINSNEEKVDSLKVAK